MRVVFFLIAALLAAGGCGAAIEVRGTLPDRPQKLAVFDFADQPARSAVRDYALGGVAGTEHSGVLVSRAMRRALAGCPPQQVLNWHDMRRQLGSARRLEPASDAEALQAGGKLGADAVVVGEVTRYRQVWALQLFNWASVAFTARCLEVGTGKELWSARIADRDFGAIEEDLCAQLCRRLGAKLTSPAKK